MIRIACLLAAASAACATGYHSRGITGGYDEAQLGDNVFRVSFEGNGAESGRINCRAALRFASAQSVRPCSAMRRAAVCAMRSRSGWVDRMRQIDAEFPRRSRSLRQLVALRGIGSANH